MADMKDLLSALTENLTAADIKAAQIKAEIAAMLASARINKGMSQKAFAEFMGVSQGMVSRWESGNANFTIEALVAIACKLDLEICSPLKAKRAQALTSNLIEFPVSNRWNSKSYDENELKEM